MLFCTSCGESAHSGANFCWKCGTALRGSEAEHDAGFKPKSLVPELAGGTLENADLTEPEIVWPDGYELIDLRERLREKIEPIPVTNDFYPYSESPFVFSRFLPLEDSPLEVLRFAVYLVVSFEGPIHELEVVRRIARMWLGDRAGPRAKDAAFIGLASARKMRWLVNDGPFWKRRGAHCERLRYRLDDSSRNPDFIAPEEFAAGVAHLLKSAKRGDATQLAIEAARQAGFCRPKAALITRIKDVVATDAMFATDEQGLVTLREESPY
jgi:hypothetical protein